MALDSLRKMSARLGQDAGLVQAGGGNTSLKEGATLWIKASGKWLIRAAEEEMFLPVPLEDVLGAIERGEDYKGEHGGLRVSVETTMHAVLPHACVIHVHSVNTLAWAVRADAPECLRARLEGVRWAWIPYVHPGLPLTLRIRESLVENPDVLVMQNHGLVVGGHSCEAAEERLHDVERRLAVPARAAPPADPAALARLSAGTGWRIADDEEVHGLATDAYSCRVASAGTMYPDHCVYLGPAVPVVKRAESPREAAGAPALLCEGSGVLVSDALTRAGREILLCLARVTARIPEGSPVRYLENWQVANLMNWDAEKYRIAMARREDSGGTLSR